jgi:hypothetical protein
MAPLGNAFWRRPATAFLRDIGAIPVEVPKQSLLTSRMLGEARRIGAKDVYPDRIFRPGADDFPYQDALRRMTDYYARNIIKHALARPLWDRRQSHNYNIFNSFFPSVLANYNHDGLAEAYCGRRHRVLSMHGTVGEHFGAPWVGQFLADSREFDFPMHHDGLLMGVPEGQSVELLGRLQSATAFRPDFIAVIGYSFAKIDNKHDDHVSFDWYMSHFQGYDGAIYVVDPQPAAVQAALADGLQSRKVVAVKAYWNVLSHVLMQALYSRQSPRSLSYRYEQILDRDGNGLVYPGTAAYSRNGRSFPMP